MPDITVPDKDQKTLGELASFPGERIRALADALRAAKPALLMRQLAARVAPTVGLSEQEAFRIIKLLATMYAVRTRQELTVDQFVDQLVSAIKGNSDVLTPELESPFKEYLRQLLSIQSLHVTAKALDVAREHEHVLCEPRVITDVRPVFGLNDEPVAAVAIHMLRISYHEGTSEERKQFFVAMSSDDVRELKTMLERAEQKETKLKGLMKSDLIWLDSEGD